VAEYLSALTPARALAIAQQARARILAHHTYWHRARQFEAVLEGMSARTEAAE
jgi:hypothetical protein